MRGAVAAAGARRGPVGSRSEAGGRRASPALSLLAAATDRYAVGTEPELEPFITRIRPHTPMFHSSHCDFCRKSRPTRAFARYT